MTQNPGTAIPSLLVTPRPRRWAAGRMALWVTVAGPWGPSPLTQLDWTMAELWAPCKNQKP